MVEWNAGAGPAANARRELPRMVAEFFALVREVLAGEPPPEELHRVRLAAKHVRYTLELFRPCYGAALESRIESLKAVQQVLGEINDCAASRRVLAAAMHVPLQRAKMERFLAARLRDKTGELRALWGGTFDAPGQEMLWARYLTRSARTPRPRAYVASH